jgi:hypothetical protein
MSVQETKLDRVIEKQMRCSLFDKLQRQVNEPEFGYETLPEISGG